MLVPLLTLRFRRMYSYFSGIRLPNLPVHQPVRTARLDSVHGIKPLPKTQIRKYLVIGKSKSMIMHEHINLFPSILSQSILGSAHYHRALPGNTIHYLVSKLGNSLCPCQ